MKECRRNEEISELLNIWEWCSRALHIKWQRRRKSRNGCLMALAFAVTEPSAVSPSKLAKIYKTLPRPLLDRKRVLTFWKVQPVPLLELSLGSFTKNSPLHSGLDKIRLAAQNNVTLDKLAQRMRGRENRFGSEWFSQGHHPEEEFSLLKKEMAPLCTALRGYLANEHAALDRLALEVLSKGGWRFGELPATSYVRKTPGSLLNRTTRLKLWETAQEVLSRELEDEERLELLCCALNRKISSSLRTAIESQGYTVDQVIDDMLNFDLHKSRDEIVA